jgi:hypothetical protein
MVRESSVTEEGVTPTSADAPLAWRRDRICHGTVTPGRRHGDEEAQEGIIMDDLL